LHDGRKVCLNHEYIARVTTSASLVRAILERRRVSMAKKKAKKKR